MSQPSQAALDAAERIYANRMSGKREFAKELFAVEIQKAIDAETALLKEQIRVADVAYNYLHGEHQSLQRQIEQQEAVNDAVKQELVDLTRDR